MEGFREIRDWGTVARPSTVEPGIRIGTALRRRVGEPHDTCGTLIMVHVPNSIDT